MKKFSDFKPVKKVNEAGNLPENYEDMSKEELLNYFNVEPGFGKREYTIGSSIFSWSDHGLDNTYESMYQ